MLADDFEWIRWQIILAIASDQHLSQELVLKGGNALNLVHRVGSRTSLDVDFSTSEGFEDLEDIESRLFRALSTRLAQRDLVLIDQSLSARPPDNPGSKWGGYVAEFKLIHAATLEACEGDHQKARLRTIPISHAPDSKRAFKIEISKNEYCDARESRARDGLTFFVNTLPMIAAEKLRAICQQMDECPGRRHKKPRARDFYDIHAVIRAGVDITDPLHTDLIQLVFDVKEVPLRLLAAIEDHRDFHIIDWPAVANSIPKKDDRGFDFYFDYVVREVLKLEHLWR